MVLKAIYPSASGLKKRRRALISGGGVKYREYGNCRTLLCTNREEIVPDLCTMYMRGSTETSIDHTFYYTVMLSTTDLCYQISIELPPSSLALE